MKKDIAAFIISIHTLGKDKCYIGHRKEGDNHSDFLSRLHEFREISNPVKGIEDLEDKGITISLFTEVSASGSILSGEIKTIYEQSDELMELISPFFKR